MTHTGRPPASYRGLSASGRGGPAPPASPAGGRDRPPTGYGIEHIGFFRILYNFLKSIRSIFFGYRGVSNRNDLFEYIFFGNHFSISLRRFSVICVAFDFYHKTFI